MKGGKSKSDSKSSSKLYVTTKPTKGAAAAKDPNKPKRHPSDFFVFLEDFWKQFKEKHLNNKSVAAVGKAARNKWKDPVCRMKCVAVASKHPVYELGAADLVVRSSPLNDTGF